MTGQWDCFHIIIHSFYQPKAKCVTVKWNITFSLQISSKQIFISICLQLAFLFPETVDPLALRWTTIFLQLLGCLFFFFCCCLFCSSIFLSRDITQLVRERWWDQAGLGRAGINVNISCSQYCFLTTGCLSMVHAGPLKAAIIQRRGNNKSHFHEITSSYPLIMRRLLCNPEI